MIFFDDFVDAHIRWREELATNLDRDNLDIDLIARDDCCDIGKWFYGIGQSNFGKLGCFSEAQDAHKIFHHAVAKSIRKTGRSGSDAEFATLIKALDRLSKSIPLEDRLNECKPYFKSALNHINNHSPQLATVVLNGLICERCTRQVICSEIRELRSDVESLVDAKKSG